jgi:hypothetical protein
MNWPTLVVAALVFAIGNNVIGRVLPLIVRWYIRRRIYSQSEHLFDSLAHIRFEKRLPRFLESDALLWMEQCHLITWPPHPDDEKKMEWRVHPMIKRIWGERQRKRNLPPAK